LSTFWQFVLEWKKEMAASNGIVITLVFLYMVYVLVDKVFIYVICGGFYVKEMQEAWS